MSYSEQKIFVQKGRFRMGEERLWRSIAESIAWLVSHSGAVAASRKNLQLHFIQHLKMAMPFSRLYDTPLFVQNCWPYLCESNISLTKYRTLAEHRD